MTMLRYGWYGISLLFFPVWLILYWVHRIFVFVTKPGAALIVPVILVGIAVALRTHVDQYLGEAITNWFYFDLLGPEAVKTPGSPASLIFEFRMELVFLWMFGGVGILIMIAGRILQPVMAAFPAPRPPLRPNAPLIVRDHKIETVVARIAVPKRKSSFNGKPASLIRRLPPEVRGVMTNSQAAAQASAAEVKAGKAQARQQAKAKAKADAAGARQQAMAERKQSEQARSDAKRRAKEEAARRQQERERAAAAKRQAKIDEALKKRQRKAQRAYEKAALKAAKRGDSLPEPPEPLKSPVKPETVAPPRAVRQGPPPTRAPQSQAVPQRQSAPAGSRPSPQPQHQRQPGRPPQPARPAAVNGGAPPPPRQFGNGRPAPPMRPPQSGGSAQAPTRRAPEPDR